MIDSVFISDLHLHPQDVLISNRFARWVDWAVLHVKQVYILGDFFHAWAGDDTLDAWSLGIAEQLMRFKKQHIPVFFMHGNRDFLLGQHFAELAGLQLLPEPTCIYLGQKCVLLVHGDRYCTQDQRHQYFRWLTRNRWFIRLFLCLPKTWRMHLVAKGRQHSQTHRPARPEIMDIVPRVLARHAKLHHADIVIHGHTHRPKLEFVEAENHRFQHIILSDWDEDPPILCYNQTKGLFFQSFSFGET